MSRAGDPEGPSTNQDLAAAFAVIARQLYAPEGEVYTTVATLAAKLVPGADHCGITVARGRRVWTAGASDPLPEQVDALQYAAGEGPCLEAIRSQPVLEVRDVAEDARWPGFTTRAREETPVRSILSHRLFEGQRTIGALNLYATKPHAFDDWSREVASLYATHAALAIGAAEEIRNLRLALESRDRIATAKGILMARERASSDEAFEMLRRASRRSNVPLRDLAAQIIEAQNETSVSPSAGR